MIGQVGGHHSHVDPQVVAKGLVAAHVIDVRSCPRSVHRAVLGVGRVPLARVQFKRPAEERLHRLAVVVAHHQDGLALFRQISKEPCQLVLIVLLREGHGLWMNVPQFHVTPCTVIVVHKKGKEKARRRAGECETVWPGPPPGGTTASAPPQRWPRPENSACLPRPASQGRLRWTQGEQLRRRGA